MGHIFKNVHRELGAILLTIVAFFLSSSSSAQCPAPTLFDLDLAVASDNPVWINCIDNVGDPDSYALDLISPVDIVDYTIDWGDGSALTTGVNWTAGSLVSHTYSDLGQYTVTLTETDNGCSTTITGTLISDRKPGATAQPPTENTNGCSPHTLTFINQTTNTSQFTRFIWDWGDGSVDNVNDNSSPGSAGNSITHTYQRGTSDCGMEVTLTAIGLCDTTFVTFGPYDMWDLDTAIVQASNTQLCQGDFVTFSDVSDYNCVGGARNLQWDFSEVGGGVTPWLLAAGPNRSQTIFIDGPVGSTYTIYMADSNFCGIDQAAVTVTIVAPPTSDVVAVDDTVCVGESTSFNNNSSGGDSFHWNFGDGGGWTTVGNTSSRSNSFSTPGDYTVSLVADVSSSVLCEDTSTTSIHVVGSPVPDFSMDANEGCDSLTVSFTDNSTDAVNWAWNFGNGQLENGAGPFQSSYSDESHYFVTLTVENSTGCEASVTDTVFVYPVPELSVLTDSICFGDSSLFVNNSNLPFSATGSIRNERWYSIGGGNLTNLLDEADYPGQPDEVLFLSSFSGERRVNNTYGNRIHGYIYPPQTGNYVFWIACDDQGELWLSTDEDPANSSLIAEVSSFTDEEQWTKFPSQQSSAVFLEAGQKYYIRALHSEGSGGDHVDVGWQLPDGTLERPIPGNRLSPYMPGQTILSWSWDFNDGSGVSTEKSPTYSYTGQGVFYPILTANTGKCVASDSFPVFVAPEVTADFSFSETTGCSPLSLELYNQSTGANSYRWEFGDGTIDTLAPGEMDTIPYDYFNNTATSRIYNLSLIATGDVGCKDTTTGSVTVFASPNANFDWDFPSLPCPPFDVEFINTSISDDTVFTWFFNASDSLLTGSGNVSRTFENEGSTIRFDTVTLVATSANGCTSTATRTLSVFPEPNYTLEVEPDTGCHPVSAQFTIPETASAYFWEFGDGTVSGVEDPLHVYTNNTTTDTSYTASVVVTSAFACSDTLETNVVVKPQIDANFSVQPAVLPNSDSSVTISNVSSGDIERYSWDLGNGITSTLENPGSYSYDTSGVYVVQLVVENDFCIDSLEQTVYVQPLPPIPQFVGGDSGCAPLSVEFMNTTLFADTYFWDFGDGDTSTLENPTHTYTDEGSYSVSLTAFGDGGQAIIVESNIVVTVDPPTSSFQAFPQSQAYPNTIVNLVNTSSSDAEDFIWDFGTGMDSSFSASPVSFEFDTVGSYVISLTAESRFTGCVDTIYDTITILPPLPVPDFIGGDTACAPLIVSFTNTTLYASEYLWFFGDGDSSAFENPSHRYEQPGDYSVTLVATGEGGTSQVTQTNVVQVLDDPTASFSVTPRTQNLPASMIAVNNTSSADATIFRWDFGDGDTSVVEEPLTHTYDTIGTYPITLTVSNAFENCVNEIQDSVTILPFLPIADFEGGDTACAPFEVSFTNATTYGTSYVWFFGDGDTSSLENPVHTFETPGDYTVTLVATGPGGVDTTSQVAVVRVLDYPVANFFGTPDEQNLPDGDVSFSNLSTSDATEFYWDFGDGDTSVQEIPDFHTYDTVGNYAVTLRIANDLENCADTLVDTIRILPFLPISSFTGGDTGCAPLRVDFTNTAEFADTYLWDFGDGTTSTEENPTHVYDTLGTYYVTLRATGPGGTDSVTRLGVVRVEDFPIANFQASPQEQALPNATVNVFNLSSNDATGFIWDFGDGDSAFVEDPITHTYDTSGGYSITLYAFNEKPNCVDTITDAIVINPNPPQANFEGGDTACAPLEVTFTNTSNYAEEYLWFFGDGDTSIAENPTHVYTEPGIYDVTLLVTGPGGSDSIVLQDIIQVLDYPEAGFLATPKEQFKPNTTVGVFENSSSDVIDWIWDFGDGDSSLVENPDAHVYADFGVYPITLTVIAPFENCRDTIVDTVIIYPEQPIANFEGGGEGCVPFKVEFTSTSSDAETWLWDFGDGNTSTNENPEHSYISAGTFDVRLTITNNQGEDSITQSQVVTAHPVPVALFNTSPSTTFDLVAPVDVFFNNLSSDADVYQWDLGDGSSSTEMNVLHNYSEAGIYDVSLVATSDFGCTDTFALFPPVTVIEGGEIYVPNAFKPEGSLAGNEKFVPVIRGNVRDYHLMIFNRWGELIFESFDPEIGWDGRYRGVLSEQEAYVYRVEVTFFEGNQKTVLGDVTLIR